jgi:hypothetical protein
VGRTRGAGGRLEAREVGRRGEPVEVWRRDVAIRFEDPDARRDDVPGQIGEEQHVAVDKTGVGEEGFEVGTWEGSHRPPCAIEVGSDRILLAQLGVRKVDVAECGGAGGGGNAKHYVGGGWRLLGGWVVAEGVAQVAATGRTRTRGTPVVDRGKVRVSVRVHVG